MYSWQNQNECHLKW